MILSHIRIDPFMPNGFSVCITDDGVIYVSGRNDTRQLSFDCSPGSDITYEMFSHAVETDIRLCQ